MALNKIALDIDINSNIISLSVVDFLKPKIQDIMEIEIAKQYVAIKDAKPTVTSLRLMS